MYLYISFLFHFMRPKVVLSYLSMSTMSTTQQFLDLYLHISWNQTAYLRSHFFLFPNTFIYESILIKKIISMTSKVIEGHKCSSNFTLTQPFPYWMVHWCFLLQIMWISLFLSPKVPLLLHLVQIYGRFCACFLSAILNLIQLFCFSRCGVENEWLFV